jgi:hypothetical protein
MMDAVAPDLNVGSNKVDNFHYKGLRVSTLWLKDRFEIVVDGDEHLDAVIPMAISPTFSDDDTLSPIASTQYRSVAGCIGYMASAFRLNLALEASLLRRSFAIPTARDARKPT